jgi:hypothetical protein
MNPETLAAWKRVVATIDLEVRMAETAAKLTPSDTTRAERDAWLTAQGAVVRKLARLHEDATAAVPIA